MEYKNRIQETTQTTGTAASLVLNGNTPGYRRFNVFANGTTLRYLLEEDGGTGTWELGVGTYNNNTLTRDASPLTSAGIGTRLNLRTGIHRVSNILAAEDLILLQGDMTQILAQIQLDMNTLRASLYAYDY